MKRYVLNQERNTLIKWLDHSSEKIDMQKDTFLKDTTIIGECAFLDCIRLEEVILPDKLTTIKHGAFLGCQKLSKIHIPDSVTQWEFSAFLCCESLDFSRLPKRIIETKLNQAIDMPDFIERLLYDRINF
ncbi:leucine-rich repeat protein [Capnocytophaga stomatis]|uniref:Leucine-rich repeat protein n=1 Tax=Capnocytophaga stomatis TaxID=1848904 RepID=A0ABW8Q7Y8_9FLAO